jgi:tryptophan synthase alpha chain
LFFIITKQTHDIFLAESMNAQMNAQETLHSVTPQRARNRIDELFERKPRNVLTLYCTAGFPRLGDTTLVVEALREGGADMIEIGMPFSDPIADGPTIQQSSALALANGMTIKRLFEQLSGIRERVGIPLVLMGYVNPVLQFGVESFADACARVGVDGVILPDLPLEVYEAEWRDIFVRRNLHYIGLVTPQTSEARMARIDGATSGFLYAVSSAGTTGGALAMNAEREAYFSRLRRLRDEGALKNPVLIGFGVADRESFAAACRFAEGGIIGSAYIKAIEQLSSDDIRTATLAFLQKFQR